MAEQADGEVQLDSPDELLAGGETETWSDDSVRMYLTQMGEIPLLTRKQEIELANALKRLVDVSAQNFSFENHFKRRSGSLCHWKRCTELISV